MASLALHTPGASGAHHGRPRQVPSPYDPLSTNLTWPVPMQRCCRMLCTTGASMARGWCWSCCRR